MTYHSKTLFIDTREHNSEVKRLEPQLEALGYECIHHGLWIGDYRFLGNEFLVVDRKKNLQELIGNVTQQHKRFREECDRAKDHGVKLIVLVEHGFGINSMDNLDSWINPRIKKSPNATTGKRLRKILETMEIEHGVEFQFCDKKHTAERIIEILESGVNDG